MKKLSFVSEFILLSSIILIAVLMLSLGFVYQMYTSYTNEVAQNLKLQTSRIERSFTTTMGQTGYLIDLLANQISFKSKDVKDIYNLISKFKTHHLGNNLLAWSTLFWTDNNNQLLIDSFEGIVNPPLNIANQDYVLKAQNDPTTFQLGKPMLKPMSSQWVIPAGKAVFADNQFIGTLSIGFDIDALKAMLKESMNQEGIDFALIDASSYKTVLSSGASEEQQNNIDYILQQPDTAKSLETLLASNTLAQPFDPSDQGILEVQFSKKANNYYLYKLPNAPYILFVSYKDTIIYQQFWESIIMRIIDISAITIIFLILLAMLNVRMIRPIAALAKTADDLARGKRIKRFPRCKSKEISNILFQLARLQHAMVKEKRHKKALEEAQRLAEESDSARERFARRVRHEMTKPLGGVKGLIEMLIMKNVDSWDESKLTAKEELDYLRSAHDGCTHIQSMISDALYVNPTDMSELLCECVKIQAKEALRKEMKIIVKEVPSNLPKLYTDDIKCKQIVTGLITRVLDFGPSGTRITIKAMIEQTPEREYFVFTIADNAFGLTDDQREKWEERDSSQGYARRPDGTDYSRSNIERLVDYLHGSIAFEDALMKGSMVTVKLPYLEKDELMFSNFRSSFEFEADSKEQPIQPSKQSKSTNQQDNNIVQLFPTKS